MAVRSREYEEAVRVVKAIGILEDRLSEAVDERDKAEQAMSQAYYLVIGRSPEWSNTFGYDEALEEIKDACAVLRMAAKSDLTTSTVARLPGSPDSV